MSISSLLKKNGFEVEAVAADYKQIKAKLQKNVPTILAYSTPTGYFRHYLELNLRLKQEFSKIFTIFGGPHSTFFPDIIEEEGIDAVCIGEGEYPMLELVNGIAAGEVVNNIQNLWIKEEGRIYRNAVRPLIENLDQLPTPDHDIFNQVMPDMALPAVVITSRGCPYNCSYCFNHAYRQIYAGKGRPIRRRSVDNVMEELRAIKKRGNPFIRFSDDIFILSRPWVEEFSRKYKEQIGLPFSCLVRANYVKQDILKMLKEAGCYRISLGIEAGNDIVRNKILKRDMSKEEIINAARLIRKVGIKLLTFNILAIPGGSFKTDWETLQLNIKCRPNYAGVSFMHPFPRTQIYNYAKEKGLLDEKHAQLIEASGGFGFTSVIRFRDKKEKRMVENLHKFFPIAVKFPFLLPLIQQLIKLPPNRTFILIYKGAVNFGLYLQMLPIKIGMGILWRKVKVHRLFGRYKS